MDGERVQKPENFVADVLDGRLLRAPVIAVRGRQVVGAEHLVVRAGLLHLFGEEVFTEFLIFN